MATHSLFRPAQTLPLYSDRTRLLCVSASKAGAPVVQMLGLGDDFPFQNNTADGGCTGIGRTGASCPRADLRGTVTSWSIIEITAS